MILYLLKRKKFLISFLFLAVLLVWSFFQGEKVQQIPFILDSKGNIVTNSPYPPFAVFLLGSDKFGYNLGQMIIQGAKYTIGSILIITLLRMLISLVISTVIYPLKPGMYRLLKMILQPFSIVPQTVIAFFILSSILFRMDEGFHNPLWQRVAFEFFILILIAIPNITIHISEEMRIVQKEAFIETSKTLGAGNRFIFFRHMVSNLYEKWILLFGQQFLQVLQLLAHLGYLGLFFGGSILGDPPKSVSNEWSGLIGEYMVYFGHDQWILLVPMCFFVLTALSVFYINDTVKDYFQSKDSIRYKQ